MNKFFLTNSILGTLNYHNVYEYYEQPRLFSVKNEVESNFIVYWAGENEDYEKWFIIPLSLLRLRRFENKEIDIRDVLEKQEQSTFMIYKKFFEDESKDEIIATERTLVNTIRLPENGIFISRVEPVYSDAKSASETVQPSHEIRLAKTPNSTEKTPRLEYVTRIFESFSQIYKSYLDFMDITDRLEPISARPGSFILSLQSEKLQGFEEKLLQLNDLIIYKRDIVDYIKKEFIDIKGLADLFSGIIYTSTNFELKSVYSDEIILTIRKKDALYYLEQVNKASVQYLTTYQVPQANDITKIFELVTMMWKGKDVNSVSLKVEPRHVAYYKHAAKLLGFINSNGALTAIGQKMAESEVDKKIRISSYEFEKSFCGWAWISWSGVESLAAIDPQTSYAFLREVCPGLSVQTAKRRASTLSTWCILFQENYVEI